MDVSETEITPEISEPNPQPIADEISEPVPQTVTTEVSEPKPQVITYVVSEPVTADVVSEPLTIEIADVVSEPEAIANAGEVSEHKPEPMEVELPVKTEPELGSEDVSSDSISEEVPESSERKEEETQEEDNGEDGNNRPSKKQKSTTEAETETDTAKTPEVEVVAVVNSNGAKKASKKKSKNINSVWTKTTSRKKKKAKNFNGGGGGGGAGGVGTSGGINAPLRKPEDAVKIMPLPRFPDKNDDSIDAKICLSKVYKAEKVELSDDRMSAGSCKGYRMVRATRGVSEGAWFFEIKVVSLGETGHTRLGWSTEKADLQAPVGYDGCSFGFRDGDGSKVHKALREKYGEEGYKEGDVIGCYISLPEGESFAPKPPQLVCYKGQKYAYANDSKEDPPKIVPGSEISFFKNGICQGVAFKDLCGGRYYPAASMYTLPNQPNCVVKFNFGPDFECFPADFEGRQIPRPMIEVPYHGYDGRVENGVLDESKQ